MSPFFPDHAPCAITLPTVFQTAATEPVEGTFHPLGLLCGLGLWLIELYGSGSASLLLFSQFPDRTALTISGLPEELAIKAGIL